MCGGTQFRECEGNVFCEVHAREFDANWRCGGCQEPIADSEETCRPDICGGMWHFKCYKCRGCRRPLGTVQPLIWKDSHDNKNFFCHTCVSTLTGELQTAIHKWTREVLEAGA